MTPDTLNFFAELLGMVSLSASAPDFEAQAARISRARAELSQALQETPPTSP